MVCDPCKRQEHEECANLYKYEKVEVPVPGRGMVEGVEKTLRENPVTTQCDCQHKLPLEMQGG
jgi:hypothetical protein